MTEADRNLRALLTSAQVVVLAFREQLEAGTLNPRQHSALRILEEASNLFGPRPASGAGISPDRPSGAGVLPTPARPAADLGICDERFRYACGGAGM